MKKQLCILAAALAGGVLAWSLEVDEPEIQSAANDSVQFENYGGPHAVIETAAAITNIGTELGLVIAEDSSMPTIVRPEGKYTLIHAVDPDTAEGLDADILLLNPNAGVDHIKNLRRIITGYLEAAYGYEREDADTLATFITIYNAVYRGQLPYFVEKYKEAVLQNLTEEKVGLSTIWSEWAGNSQIVIPLNDPNGGISSVDTTAISDEQVVEALRQEEDKGIEARQNLTELKEKEATTATQQAQAAQKEAAVQKAEAAKAETAEEAQVALEKAEAAAEEATEQQQLADKKNYELEEERQEIKEDLKTITTIDSEEDTTNYATGLFGADDLSGLYQMMTVDTATGTVVRSSDVTDIRGKTVFLVSDVYVEDDEGTSTEYPTLYMAVCGENDGHSAVKLCLIEASNLEIIKQSDETLSETSELVRSNDNFYVVIEDEEGAYIAMYDKKLTLLAKGEQPVKATTPLNLISAGILVTADDGSPLLLDTQTLETVW